MQYTVQQGDTLYSLARRYRLTVEQLAAANQISPEAELTPGEIITIPTIEPVDQPGSSNDNAYQPDTGGSNNGNLGGGGSNNRPGNGNNRPGGGSNRPGNGNNRPGGGSNRPGNGNNRPGGGSNRPGGGNNSGSVPSVPRPWPGGGTPGFPGGSRPPIPSMPAYPPQEYFCPVLRPGSRGAVVLLLQRLLRARGYYNGPEDGVFNARLQQGLRMFQQDNGIYTSGIACGRTWNLLGVSCGQAPQINDSLPASSGVSRGLRQTLYTDRRIYRPNQSIQIMLSKTNVTSDPVSLRYSTSQLIEIVVQNIYGQEVWRYSWNRTFSPYGRLITIMPDGTQRISEIWNQRDNQGDPVYSGLYSISVQNLATGLNLTVQVEIS